MTGNEIFEDRKNKFLKIGRNKGFIRDLENLSSLNHSDNKLNQIFRSKKTYIFFVALGLIATISLFFFL